MPTTVHIPKLLLDAADRRARKLGVSRNRLIVRALEKELGAGTGWSSGFFERLRAREAGVDQAAGEMLTAILSGRRSKPPKAL